MTHSYRLSVLLHVWARLNHPQGVPKHVGLLEAIRINLSYVHSFVINKLCKQNARIELSENLGLKTNGHA